MKKVIMSGLALALVFTRMQTFSAFGTTGWHTVG